MTLIWEQQTSRVPQKLSAFPHSPRAKREQRGWSPARVAQRPVMDSRTMDCGEWDLVLLSLCLREKFGACIAKTPRDFLNHEHDSTPPSAGSLLDSDLPLLLACPSTRCKRKLLLLCRRLRPRGTLVFLAPNGLPDVRKTAIAPVRVQNAGLRAHFKHGVLWAGSGPHPGVPRHTNRRARLPDRASTLVDPADLDSWFCTLRGAACAHTMLLIIDTLWSTEDALVLTIGGPTCAHVTATHFRPIVRLLTPDRALKIEESTTDESLSLSGLPARDVVKREIMKVRTLVEGVGGLSLTCTLIGNHLQRHYSLSRSQHISTNLQVSEETSACLSLTNPRLPSERCSMTAVTDKQPAVCVQPALSALLVFPAKAHSFSGTARCIADCSTQALDLLIEVAGRGYFNAASKSLLTSVTTFVTTYSTDYQRPAREQYRPCAAGNGLYNRGGEQACAPDIRRCVIPAYNSASTLWLNVSSLWRQSHLLSLQTSMCPRCRKHIWQVQGRDKDRAPDTIPAEQPGEKFCQCKGISQRRNRHESGQISTAATHALD